MSHLMFIHSINDDQLHALKCLPHSRFIRELKKNKISLSMILISYFTCYLRCVERHKNVRRRKTFAISSFYVISTALFKSFSSRSLASLRMPKFLNNFSLLFFPMISFKITLITFQRTNE